MRVARKLSVQDYETLGGMEGSIQTCIERIVPPTSLSASDGAALRLTFVKHLAQVNDKGEVVRLQGPLGRPAYGCQTSSREVC